ncbi:MAG: hypothetical protein U0441_32190 [Polyangiaceae bacterium]
MRASFVAFFFTLIPLFATSGCTEEFVATGGSGGGSTTSTTGGGGQTTGTTTSSSQVCSVVNQTECDTCLVGACSKPYCGCADSQDCLDLVSCAGSAQSQEELRKCGFDHPNSISLAGRLNSCGAMHCADPCGLGPADNCAACEYDKCGNQIDNCFGSEACTALFDCLKPCGAQADPQKCKTDCYSAHQEGTSALQSLASCAVTYCSTPCGI